MQSGFRPTPPHLYFIKSRIDIQKEEYDAAEKSVQQAIYLDPMHDYFAWLANIKLARLQKKYEESLSLANRALEIDPEDLLALNVRRKHCTG